MTALLTDTPADKPLTTALLALTLVVAGSALLWQMAGQPQREWPAPATITVSLEGEHYRLSRAQLEGLNRLSALHYSEGGQQARALVAGEVEAWLEQTFGAASARLPAFADWYYSLPGEYSRITMALLGYTGLADQDYVARRAGDMLFAETTMDDSLAAMQAMTLARLADHQAGLRAGWLASLQRQLAAHRVPAPLPGGGQGTAVSVIELGELITSLSMREQARLESRLALSSVTAGSVLAGSALWRAGSRRSAAAAGRAAAARGTGKAGAAGATAGLCLGTGPAAVACALVAGSAVWLATDWALLRLDESMHREQLLAELESGLAELRSVLAAELMDTWDGVLAAHYADLGQEIESSFVPIAARQAHSRP